MVRISKNLKIDWFEYIYMFIVVIYMGSATADTKSMQGADIKNQLVPIAIPLFMTILLAIRNKVVFKNVNLRKVLFIFIFWCAAEAVKFGFGLGSYQAIGFTFFLFYAIFVAYIHSQVFGKEYFPVFEQIIVVLSVVSLVFWCIAVFMPSFANTLFKSSISQEVTFGNNFLYLFTWMDPAKGQIYGGIPRNAGWSWEPGRYAIMLCLAICLNVIRNGKITFRNNKKLIILLVSLLSTQSTTGYSSLLILWSLYTFNGKGIAAKFSLIFVVGVSIAAIASLDFMGDKLEEQTNFTEEMDYIDKQISAADSRASEGEYWMSLNRFPSAYFECYNIGHDPILGYTQIPLYSYFYNEISTNVRLTGGLMKVLAEFGIPLGLFLYILLYKSSIAIASEYPDKQRTKILIFVCFLLSSISYVLFCVPVFMTIWFYGQFAKRNIQSKHIVRK